MIQIVVLLALWFAIPGAAVQTTADRNPGNRGVLLEDLTWTQAEKALTPETVVVIPLGAAAKEHGPHLKLKNDWMIAEYLKRRILKTNNVVIAPTVNYGYYPAFAEYPGSTSLRLETMRDMLVDICRSLARFGPKRFYVLNTGISTLRALAPAAETLRADGILFRYSDLKITEPVEQTLRKEPGGTHAEEIETSMMLYIAPETVDMSKAVRDYHPENGLGGLTRTPGGGGVYSPTGVWGDATLATREKGRVVVEALAAAVSREIEDLSREK
jgi:creatinine amidohydrolase